MSDIEAQVLKRPENTGHTTKDTNSKTLKIPTKNDDKHGSFQSTQSSKQPLLREREADQAHEEEMTGCLCPILAHIPRFHWSKNKERRLAGDQFAYSIWHNPREELDESTRRRGCPDCKSLCNCPGVWRWWPGWGGN